MHLFIFIKIRNAFRFGQQTKLLLIVWMLFMTIIPVLVRTAENFGDEKTALLFAWPGYLWMGFLFIFASTLFFTDVIHFLYFLLLRTIPGKFPKYLTSRSTCIIALFIATSASAYACFEAGQIQSDQVLIKTTKLPSSIQKIRIIQISDVHIGLLLQKNRLQRIAEIIKEAKPDILVSTGDLVDGKLNRNEIDLPTNPLSALLASLHTTSGKFAIVGNHEVYAGLPQAIAFSRAAGFTVIRNNSIQLANGLTITGVDDQAVIGKKHADPAVENELFNHISPESFNILLKHRPDIQQESDGRFDLQLSGHVHGGQIFPFNFFVKLKHPIPCGTTITEKGSYIHVSRGTGTWGPPMRLFVPPEITIIDVVPK
jgi:predicted MPP superfamily phosphohydrolase